MPRAGFWIEFVGSAKMVGEASAQSSSLKHANTSIVLFPRAHFGRVLNTQYAIRKLTVAYMFEVLQ